MWFAKSGWYHNMIPTKKRERRTPKCLKYGSLPPITRQSTKKMQVAAYCRVSSNSADQLNSYAAQIRAYKKCIGARDDWELVDIFADEGLTGMKSETRDEFQRMIRMCELKQIDLIITKSISRFARNTKDALAYVRKLKLLGVGVQFEKGRHLDTLYGRRDAS